MDFKQWKRLEMRHNFHLTAGTLQMERRAPRDGYQHFNRL